MRNDLLDVLFWAASIIIAVAISTSFCGCQTPAVINRPVTQKYTCEQAYAHIAAVGCHDILTIPGADETEDTADDMHWIRFCQTVQNSGTIQLGLDCAMSVNSCPEIESCL